MTSGRYILCIGKNKNPNWDHARARDLNRSNRSDLTERLLRWVQLVAMRRCSCYIIMLSATLLIHTTASAAAAVTPPQVIFAYSTTSPYPCIRIPSALALPGSRTILAFAETRRWIGDQCYPDAPKPAAQESNRSICLRRSLDAGATWLALRPNISQRYSANPTALHDATTNRTLLFFDDTLNGHLYMQRSTDSGDTWSLAMPLRTAAGLPISAICGPGNAAVATANGTIFVAGYHASRDWTSSFSFASVYRSDNHGVSWEGTLRTQTYYRYISCGSFSHVNN